jgi:tetratricopeptide (TPR) repeat protein
MRLAELAGVTGDPEVDAVHLRHARRLALADPDLLMYAGSLELQAGRLSEACTTWRQCLRVAPERTDAVLDLVAANLDLGTCLEDLLPDAPEVLIRVARDRFSGRSQQDLRRAIANKTDRLVRSGKFTESEQLYYAGVALALQDQHLRAIHSIARAVKLAPDRTSWRYELALLLRQRGMFDEAKEQARQCVRLEPDNERYQRLLRQLIRTGIDKQERNLRT